jgi:hypothetical protein
MKIPQMFQDYSDDDPAIDKRVARWDFWKALIKLKTEYSSTTEYEAKTFLIWLENTYGLTPLLDPISGGITDDYQIVDEKKFLIFTLKYLGD